MNNLPNSVPEAQKEYSETMEERQDFAKRLKDATHYINFGIRHGKLAPEDFFGLTDEQLVKEAEKLMDKGDYIANSGEEEND